MLGKKKYKYKKSAKKRLLKLATNFMEVKEYNRQVQIRRLGARNETNEMRYCERRVGRTQYMERVDDGSGERQSLLLRVQIRKIKKEKKRFRE